MPYGYEGSLVRLVPLDEEKHFENALRWINDPQVSEWLAVGDHPMTRLAEKEWFDNVSKLSTHQVAFAIETLQGEHLGFSNLFNINHRNGQAESGSMIGNPNAWGKGYGTEAARIRATYAFDVLGLRQIFSNYLEGNVRSARMQEKAGYVIWGTQPEAIWKRGRFQNIVHTVLKRPSV